MQEVKAREIVFLNGEFLNKNAARISALDPGFLCGLGLFETMRSYNHRIVYLDSHLKRLKSSCSYIGLGMPYSLDRIKGIIKETVKINGLQDAYVRLTLWKQDKGTAVAVITKEFKPYPASKYNKGFSAQISRLRQSEYYLLAKIKSTSRISYELSFKEAKDKGFDEAIILNNRGNIAEASRSNIFLVKNKGIFTPSLECGCLDGITRKVIFDLAKKHKIALCQGNLTIQDLCSAHEAFLTNSLIGIMPLTSIEHKIIGKGKCENLTKFLISKYNSLLK
jgi:branched-subunit amino acid aminotransferase/4-amino-4-deoxychorismate lyase